MRRLALKKMLYSMIAVFTITIVAFQYQSIDVKALEGIPDYNSAASIPLNGNIPSFQPEELSTTSFETYGALDGLGRCTTAVACIGTDLMPTEERGSIGDVKPTGWIQNKYPGIVDSQPPYLYNRCHLIGFQLTAENANVQNLITGTRYMNVEAMLPYENMVADYIKSTGNHVMYRVTPVFEGNNLLCSGVIMEAYSVEDSGAGISFNVYCYNVQPGAVINYADGSNFAADGVIVADDTNNAVIEPSTQTNQPQASGNYVANTNTRKFHYSSCSSVADMSEHNKLYFDGSREELINQGYEPCKRCNP